MIETIIKRDIVDEYEVFKSKSSARVDSYVQYSNYLEESKMKAAIHSIDQFSEKRRCVNDWFVWWIDVDREIKRKWDSSNITQTNRYVFLRGEEECHCHTREKTLKLFLSNLRQKEKSFIFPSGIAPSHTTCWTRRDASPTKILTHLTTWYLGWMSSSIASKPIFLFFWIQPIMLLHKPKRFIIRRVLCPWPNVFSYRMIQSVSIHIIKT